MPATFTTRPWQPGDVPFLWDMLYESIHVAEDIPELGTAVVAAWRGRGVGTRVIDELAERNPLLSLSVDNENEDARRLYSRLGFVPLGVSGTTTTMLRRPPT